MNDIINYSWSVDYSSNTTEKPADTSDEMIAFDLCSKHNLPDNTILARSQRSQVQRTIKTDVFYLLNNCTEFKTRDEHFNYLAELFPNIKSHPAEIKQILNEVCETGLMLKHRDVVKTLSHTTDETPPESKPVVFIPTCDRPESLKRLLLSIHANCDLSQIAHCIVLEDSRMQAHHTRNQQVIEEINHAHPFKIRYIGASKQDELISLLTQKLPMYQDEIDFLIGRTANRSTSTPGRSRNLALLLSVGQNALLLDDDILCQAINPPISKTGIEISFNPRDAEFYKLKEDWLPQKPAANSDPLALHAQHLGMQLGTALQKLTHSDESNHQLQIESTNAIEKLSAQSKILITACGTYGDPGTSSGEWIYHLSEASRSRLCESEDKYSHAKTTRNNWLGRSRYHLTNSTILMSAVTGLHNHELLPPYFPSLSNEDYLFGKMTQLIHPDALVMDYPWAVPHLPVDERTWGHNDNKFNINPGFLRLTSDLLHSAENSLHSKNAQLKLTVLAHLFLDQSETPYQRLHEMLTEHITTIRTERLCSLNQALVDSPNAPDYWKKDIKNGIDTYQSSLTDQEDLRIADGPDNAINGVLLDYMTTSWRQFGKALLAWPQIREAAATIIDQGFLE